MDEKDIKILVVDDEESIRKAIKDILLSLEYKRIYTAQDGLEALQRIQEGKFDLMITDLEMPRMGGRDLIQKVFSLYPDSNIIVVSSTMDEEIINGLTKNGILGFLWKPFSINEFILLLEEAGKKCLYLEKFMDETQKIEPFLSNLESTFYFYHNCSKKLSEISIEIGRAMDLSCKQLKSLELAALAHDVGMVKIDKAIVNKPKRLTGKEYEIVKKHPQFSQEMLYPVLANKEILPIVYTHHEWYGGSGYPQGLKGEEIPLESRILAIADAFIAMSSDRPYRRAKTKEEIFNEFERNDHLQWDSKITDVFCNNVLPNLEILVPSPLIWDNV